MIKHTFQVETWPISCLKYSKTQEGGLYGVEIRNISQGACPRTPLEAYAFCARLENRPVFILDPRLLYTAYFSNFSDHLSHVLKHWGFEAHQPTLPIYRSDSFYNA